ncbi:type I toxin-antitoxin system Fst family toxin [Streptococcus pneumoniae]|nr:type I toxin-antitoxin system Fst family toxin [Streptococcus pneumoniae]
MDPKLSLFIIPCPFSFSIVTIIAPIIVGVILTLFSHWLNNQ